MYTAKTGLKLQLLMRTNHAIYGRGVVQDPCYSNTFGYYFNTIGVMF